MGRLPESDPLCSQSTISRLENLPDRRTLLRMSYGMIDFYCDSFRQVPRRIVLDIDDHFDATHGEQELRVFNAHYDEYGFSPIVVFDGDGRLVGAVLRPAQRPSGCETVVLLRRLIGRIRASWPRVDILLRGDSHYCTPDVLTFCRANRVDWVLGVATTPTLRRHIIELEHNVAKRFAAAGDCDKVRRFKQFYDGAASWDRVERIIARVEAGPDGVDTRFITTNLPAGSPRAVYEKVASAARWKIISNHSSDTSRLIARPATRPTPIRCDCSSTRCTAPDCLDNRLRYAARLKASSCQAARIWAGLRYPFFSMSHSAL